MTILYIIRNEEKNEERWEKSADNFYSINENI